MQDEKLNAILLEAYNHAPPYIQSFLNAGTFDAFMIDLTTHFGLHADVAEKVSNEILMTLLGLASPSELPENLRNEAGVAEGIINPILEKLNTEVFIPLRESLKQESAPKETTPMTVTEAPAPTQEEKWITMTPEVPVAAPAVPQPAPAPLTPPAVAPAPAPVAPTTPTYQAPVAPPAPQKVAEAQSAPTPEYHEVLSMMRTMSKDIESLKNGTQPQMEAWKPVSVPVTQQPHSFTPPVAPQSVITPAEPPRPQTVSEPVVHERITAPLRASGEDPYREPVE